MEREPEDAEGWMMLGRSFAVMDASGESSAAYAKAGGARAKTRSSLPTTPTRSRWLKGGRSGEKPELILKRALAADPNNVKARWSSRGRPRSTGTTAQARCGFGSGPRRPPRRVRNGAESAREHREARGPGRRSPNAVAKAPQAPGGARVSGVSRSTEAAGKVAPDDTVFIFARAAEGPRMPLAILRRQGATFRSSSRSTTRWRWRGDEALGVSPRRDRGARLKSAHASAAPGDLQGSSAPDSVAASAST